MLLVLYQISLFVIDLLTFLWKAILTYLQEIVYIVFPPVKKCVKDDVVLITGGGQGLGKELALLFAKLESTVILWDINEETLMNTAAEIKKQDLNVRWYVCDVSNREEVMKTAQRVRNEVGDVSMLINNAGILPCQPFLTMNHEQIQRCMDVNTMAHFWTIQAFLPAMIEHGQGHIVGISSMAAKGGFPNIVPYCASKHAVCGLLSALAEEMRFYRNADVNFTTVYPSILNTTMAKRPRVKYPFLFPIVDVEQGAKSIVDGILRNDKKIFLPSHLNISWRLITNLPLKVQEHFVDFIGYGLDPHDS